MFRAEPVMVSEPLVMLDPKTNQEVGVSPIDQVPAQEFTLGVSGLPANDITLLSRATNSKDYEMILARLEEIHADNPDNSNKSDEQIVGEIMPNWVSNPYLMNQFIDYYNQTHPVPFKVNESAPSEPTPVEPPVEPTSEK